MEGLQRVVRGEPVLSERLLSPVITAIFIGYNQLSKAHQSLSGQVSELKVEAPRFLGSVLVSDLKGQLIPI